MRTSRSHIFIAAVAASTIFGLAACVPSADDDKSDDTMVTLGTTVVTIPPPTSTTTTLPGAVIITAGSVPQPPVSATAVPPPNDTEDTEATTATPTTSGATTTTSASGPGEYTIAGGDTLFAIAKKCSIGPAELANYNDWDDGIAHIIIAGQKIKMPCKPAASTTATTVAGATTTTVAGGSGGSTTTVAEGPGGTYTVQSGDFLSGIAAKTGTTVDAIVEVNGWTDGADHVIFPGQVIKMPARS